jgi:hypothetical protein
LTGDFAGVFFDQFCKWLDLLAILSVEESAELQVFFMGLRPMLVWVAALALIGLPVLPRAFLAWKRNAGVLRFAQNDNTKRDSGTNGNFSLPVAYPHV